MIMGLAAQMVNWPDSPCHELARRGLHVIRCDHRDAGRSTHVTGAPALVLFGMSARFSPANYGELAGLWERLVAVRQAAGGSRRDESFAVFFDRAPGGVFEYFATWRAWSDVVPAPLERVRPHTALRCAPRNRV